jgi:serine/threonine protein kinase
LYYAIKVLKKDKIQNPTAILAEIENLTKLDHPNLVRFYGQMSTKKRIILIQEYLTGDDLFTVAQQANERGIMFDEGYIRKVFL